MTRRYDTTNRPPARNVMDDDWKPQWMRDREREDFADAREDACVERIAQALEEVRSEFPDQFGEITIALALMETTEEPDGKRKYDLGTLVEFLRDAVEWDKQVAQEEEQERLRKLRKHYGSP
jgi:hypothetical protein